MYKIIKIRNYAATRDIELQNLNTNTINLCFDDSAVVSYNNFDFIEEGRYMIVKWNYWVILSTQKVILM